MNLFEGEKRNLRIHSKHLDLCFQDEGKSYECVKTLHYLLMIRACSSIRFPSPITMGPASAMIRAFG